MKILSIGNSFSQDAQRWLHSIAMASGDNIDTYNLFIGGCSLETHWNCIANNLCDYSKEGNHGEWIGNTTVLDALKSDTFDIVTIQQASGSSGQPQTYIPYLNDVIEFAKKHQPNAKIYFHKTWSYEKGSHHGEFVRYNHDSKEMFRRITDCAIMASKLIDAPVIPVGDVIQSLRENTKEFDYENGGISLCRDTFHLSLDYGRFAAGATWYKSFTGKDVNLENFVELNPEFDINLLKIIAEHINQICSK